MNNVAAIIPAAGLSTRMKDFKPLLPLADGVVLSECIRAFKANNISQIIVVTGKRSDEVEEMARQHGAISVHNASYESGMYSSVVEGVKALGHHVSAFFMLPVDIPLIRNETVQRLVEFFRRHTPRILYPRFRGERGHPPLISAELIDDILAHDGSGGLQLLLEHHEQSSMDLDVADFGAVHDLDHPIDYRLAKELVGSAYPIESECWQLWDMYAMPAGIRSHCRAVAKVSDALCRKLNILLPDPDQLDASLVKGAALTHDIGKGSRHHEQVGAVRLMTHGFTAAAEIVRAHTDFAVVPNTLPSEAEVVFLADKLVQRDSFTTLDDRYTAKLDQYGHIPTAKQNILGRFKRARMVLDRLDLESGMSMESVAKEVLS